jgi:hypothetical protein
MISIRIPKYDVGIAVSEVSRKNHVGSSEIAMGLPVGAGRQASTIPQFWRIDNERECLCERKVLKPIVHNQNVIRK